MLSLSFDLGMNDDVWYDNIICLKNQLKSLKKERSKWIQKHEKCKTKLDDYNNTETILYNLQYDDDDSVDPTQRDIWRENYKSFVKYYDLIQTTIHYLNKDIKSIERDLELTKY